MTSPELEDMPKTMSKPNPYPKAMHPISLRFTEEQMADLEDARERYGTPIPETVRRAVTAYFEALRRRAARSRAA